MAIITRIVNAIIKQLQAETVYAHCDVPCGIYDPHLAQIAAHTVVRMDALMAETTFTSPCTTEDSLIYSHRIARLTAVKEEHAELAKRELRILWADYFRPEHVEQYPELHDAFWKAMKAGSAARQNSTMESGQALLSATQQIAEIFWKTKGANPVRQPSRQTSGDEIVYPS